MSVCMAQNLRVSISVKHFNTQDKELDFGDFKIISLKQGPERAQWVKRLNVKYVPRNILVKEFPNHRMKCDDISGFDAIIESIEYLLLLFRLFKIGDIMFNDILIEDLESKKEYPYIYSPEKLSIFTYGFSHDDIGQFNSFRDDTTNKVGYNNSYYKFALNYFMSGVNKGFLYRIENLERIVDYVIALESLFLIGKKGYPINRTIQEKVSKFLKDDSLRETLKYMYGERSNIVHGNNISLSNIERQNKIEEIKTHMPRFENLIRDVFKGLFELNFSTKGDIVKCMKGL